MDSLQQTASQTVQTGTLNKYTLPLNKYTLAFHTKLPEHSFIWAFTEETALALKLSTSKSVYLEKLFIIQLEVPTVI